MANKGFIRVECDYCGKLATVEADEHMCKGKSFTEWVWTLDNPREHEKLADWEVDHRDAVCPECIENKETEVVAYIMDGGLMNIRQPPKQAWRRPIVINRDGWSNEKYFILFDFESPQLAFLVEAWDGQSAFDYLFDNEDHGDTFAVPPEDYEALNSRDYGSFAGNDSRPIQTGILVREVSVDWKASTWGMDQFGTPIGREAAWKLKQEERKSTDG